MTMLASLAIVYLLAVLFVIVLSRQITIGAFGSQPGNLFLFVSVAVLFPAALLVAIGISVARLVRDRRSGRPGSTFKARLTAFFAVVVALSSLPQGVVSVSFLNASLGVLFDANTGVALRDGLRIALQYYDHHVQVHDGIHTAGFFQERSGLVRSDPDLLWRQLNERLPGVASLQVFDEGGVMASAHGEEALFSDYRSSLDSGLGASVRTSRGRERFLRSAEYVPGGGTRSLVVVASRLPAGFDDAAARLTTSVALFEELEKLRPTFLATVSFIYIALASPMFLLSILVGFFLSDQVIRPIESLEAATRRIAQGDFSVRIFSRTTDDLGLLVMSFNRMAQELERNRRLLARTEKVMAWQDIAQRLAHEVKNPLTPIRLATERLRRKYAADSDDFPEVLERTTSTVIKEVDALATLLNEFRSFSRVPDPDFQVASIYGVIAETAEVFHQQSNVEVDLSGLTKELTLPIDLGQMRQVFMNLFTNAVEASRGGALTISVSSTEVTRAGAEYCRIRVVDNGPGIPPELQERIFDPYFTTKSEGTGLGLAIVERIVFDHHGQIWLETEQQSGASFFIDMPLELT